MKPVLSAVFAGALACSLLAVAVTVRAASNDMAPPGDAKGGKEVYRLMGCGSCHGLEGQGVTGLANAARLGPPILPYPAFYAYVRRPPGIFMPPYSPALMTDQEMADMYAFLKTKPMPPPVSQIPLLRE